MKVPDDIILTIRPKHPRPVKLSDPGSDFSPEELEAIIRKRDADLTDTDLICIFQGVLPAGKYDEAVYFLPLALERICGSDDDGATTLCENLLQWVGEQKSSLEADALHDRLLTFFDDLFAELVSEFTLDGDYPKNGDRATTIVEALNSVPGFDKRGDRLLQTHFGGAKNYEQSAWLIYFWADRLWGRQRNSGYLQTLADDQALLQKAYDAIIAEVTENEKLLTFWDRILTSCGIG